MRFARSLIVMTLLAACGGPTASPTPAASPSPAAPTPTAAQSAGPTQAASGGLPSATELCALLTPLDWSQFTFTNAQQPLVSGDPGSAYCVYAGQSGATGGLELDSFVDASVAAAQGTFDTISGEMPNAQPVDLPGADQALMNTNVDGTFGAIVVRAGRFTYTISLPTSAGSQVQLESLAGLVLMRAGAYR